MQIPVVWSESFRLHVPRWEVWVGVQIPGTEYPERAEVIRRALEERSATIVAPRSYLRSVLETVHAPDLVDFLSTAWQRWSASSYIGDPGIDRVVPYAFPLAKLTSGRPARRPVSVGALTGVYAIDTMTLIGPGTWEAVEAAAFAALTAADMVAEGEQAAYAACRPPGHHAGRDFYGGSCYLNNAALAAQRLHDTGAGVVTVIDLDAHHGNGTQEIFYRRGDIRYGSVHIDPGQGWFPHFVGFADEIGDERGEGANLNLPIPEGTGDGEWLEAVSRLAGFAAGSDALVVSLGVDAAITDPESPLRVTGAGYARAGRIIGGLRRPTAIVQEGGYDLGTLGDLVSGFLTGLEEGMRG